jgi:hypothetical protein
VRQEVRVIPEKHQAAKGIAEHEPSGSRADLVPPEEGAEAFLAGPVSAMIDHAHAMHQNLQETVRMVDQKAATLIAAEAVVVALLGASLVQELSRTLAGSHGMAFTVLAAGSLAFTLGAAGSAVMVFLPRSPGPGDVAAIDLPPRLMWASDIGRFFQAPGDYVRAVLSMRIEDAIADVAYETLKTAWIVQRKMAWMRRAVWLLLFAIAGWAGTVAVSVRGG